MSFVGRGTTLRGRVECQCSGTGTSAPQPLFCSSAYILARPRVLSETGRGHVITETRGSLSGQVATLTDLRGLCHVTIDGL